MGAVQKKKKKKKRERERKKRMKERMLKYSKLNEIYESINPRSLVKVNRIKSKQPIQRHIRRKLWKAKDNEKILKAAKKKKFII